MVHPMYKIDDLLERFPLVGKALERTESEIEGALFWVLGEMPLIALPRQIMETIDQNIERSDAEKQALMVCAFYTLAIEARTDDQEKFAIEYDAITAAVMKDFLAHQKDTVASANVAQVSAILTTCITSAVTETISELNDKSHTGEEVAAAKKEFSDSERFILPNLSAPKLLLRLQETKEKYFAALDNSIAAPVSKKPCKSNGPKL